MFSVKSRIELQSGGQRFVRRPSCAYYRYNPKFKSSMVVRDLSWYSFPIISNIPRQKVPFYHDIDPKTKMTRRIHKDFLQVTEFDNENIGNKSRICCLFIDSILVSFVS